MENKVGYTRLNAELKVSFGISVIVIFVLLEDFS